MSSDFPMQIPSDRKSTGGVADTFDMRNGLDPTRLTLAMWDQAWCLRHLPDNSFADYDRVLNEAADRGYNTLRLDPLLQWVDLRSPETVLNFVDPQMPYMPWNWNTAVTGPVGRWQIEFMGKALAKGFHYTLSAWWFCQEKWGPKPRRVPTTHVEAAEMWLELLTVWKSRFGLKNLIYIDIANEVPYFLPGFLARFEKETGAGWHARSDAFTPAQIAFLAKDLNDAMRLLQREFPELRFTASIHGDLRWLDVPLEFDCLDVHFYADADPRWTNRTRFHDYMDRLFTDTEFHKPLSDAAMKTHAAMAPMLRARQRAKLLAFAEWSQRRGMPLTTSESWACWYYFDSPDLDWSWLLEWAEWSVEDAIDARMWGWTPHNYVQPQFKNWQDAPWHQRLTKRFLKS